MTQSESAIQSDIRLALGQRDDVMLIRINVGKFRPLHGNQNRVIVSAPTGTPDLLGVRKRSVPPHIREALIRELSPSTLAIFVEAMGWTMDEWADGIGMAIEVKKTKGQQSYEQKNFQRAWERRGGLYILARSVDDVLSRIDSQEDV